MERYGSGANVKPAGPIAPRMGATGPSAYRWSEYYLYAELNVSCRVDRRGLAEGAVRQASIGVLQVHVVEQVKELTPDLNACGLILPEPRDLVVLDQVEVGVDVSRTDVGIAAEVSFLTQARYWEIGPREDTIQEFLFVPTLESAERGHLGIVGIEPVGVVVAAAVPDDLSTRIRNRDKGIVT